MDNCKRDFLDAVKGHELKCAKIVYGCDHLSPEGKKSAFLPVGFSEEQYTDFLRDIDYDYDSGYGSQEVFGTIWYNDGTWSERGEYDGSEWWEYKSCPKIPAKLRAKKNA